LIPLQWNAPDSSFEKGSAYMILSFHPCIDADVNVIVAGRAPGSEENTLIKGADAVILPQGVRQDLYDLSRYHCSRVFPNYDHRFKHPGKIGDTLLFRAVGIPHPETHIFRSVADYLKRFPPEQARFPFSFPLVLKGNYSGEGRMVFKIYDLEQLRTYLEQFREMEKSGTQGFIIQQWIDHGGRDVRVVIIHERLSSYWRAQPDPQQFLTNISAGGIIDQHSDPNLLKKAEKIAHRFCQHTGINLAGIDVMFDKNDRSDQPLLLEINYWFGRRFFGSSEVYYSILKEAIKRWLASFDSEWPKRIR
jgi:ribosomal protein S6--L-glutamate ligase